MLSSSFSAYHFNTNKRYQPAEQKPLFLLLFLVLFLVFLSVFAILMYQSFAAPKRPTPVFRPGKRGKTRSALCPRKSKRKEIKTVMLTVMKFGGSSVADLAHIRNVAQRCIENSRPEARSLSFSPRWEKRRTD